MWTTPDPPSTPFVAASNWSGTGEVNTAPGHAASSMPRPTSPPLMGFFIARFSFRCTRCVVPLRRAALRRPAVARPALVASLRRLHRVTLGGGLLQRELRDH